MLTGAALSLALGLLDGLEIDSAAMQRNLGPFSGSEQALAILAPQLGKHRAQAALQEALTDGRRRGWSLVEALAAANLLDEAAAQRVTEPSTGSAAEMVDLVIRRARTAREQEPERWP